MRARAFIPKSFSRVTCPSTAGMDRKREPVPAKAGNAGRAQRSKRPSCDARIRRKVRQGDLVGGGRDGAPNTWWHGGQGLHPCRKNPPFAEGLLSRFFLL